MILFFGPQGSGKGTQAELLSKKYNWPCLSVGDLLRSSNDPEIHDCQQRGVLVSNDKVNEVLTSAIQEHKADDNFILDGYPRQVEQAQWLTEECKKLQIAIDAVIVFDVEKEELLKRMALRGRHDDTPESIEKRLSIYYQESMKVLDYMEQNNVKVCHVDGLGLVEDIHDRVLNVIKECKLA